ncbi:signal peptidase II [Williamsoniiplasma luminosum]|uniref:Lipoprotein signal peptidase n=1 Tax=Williamsoniiplasma luminosum TaxID=214888 RepID=A0A2S0NJ42_9MOLU|nr:signal peptidase II [Williamsoniiplasma luminosum]AVP49029.1 MAG: lipoprotein signal peptidase [Williamsoniiplasma luminosum]
MWLNIAGKLKNYEYQWKFKLLVCLPIFLILVAIDWISKGLITTYMAQGEEKEVIKNFLFFHFVINPGAAKGMLDGQPVLVMTIATILTLFMFTAIIFTTDKKWLIGFTIFLSGSFANLLARAWAPMISTPEHQGVMGGVVDFIKIKWWLFGDFIMNIADAWVSISIGVLVLCVLIDIVKMFVKPKAKDVQDQSIVTIEINTGTNETQTTVKTEGAIDKKTNSKRKEKICKKSKSLKQKKTTKD